MANVVVIKENDKKTVEAGSNQEKALLKAGFKREVAGGAPEQGNALTSILSAVGKNTKEIAIPAGTDLAQLRKELETMGKMASGASVPSHAAVGPCLSAVCTKPTRLVLSRQSGNYYFREDYNVTDADGNEFTAFCLNNGVEVNEGDSMDVEVVDGAATRTGLALQYIAQ